MSFSKTCLPTFYVVVCYTVMVVVVVLMDQVTPCRAQVQSTNFTLADNEGAVVSLQIHKPTPAARNQRLDGRVTRTSISVSETRRADDALSYQAPQYLSFALNALTEEHSFDELSYRHRGSGLDEVSQCTLSRMDVGICPPRTAGLTGSQTYNVDTRQINLNAPEWNATVIKHQAEIQFGSSVTGEVFCGSLRYHYFSVPASAENVIVKVEQADPNVCQDGAADQLCPFAAAYLSFDTCPNRDHFDFRQTFTQHATIALSRTGSLLSGRYVVGVGADIFSAQFHDDGTRNAHNLAKIKNRVCCDKAFKYRISVVSTGEQLDILWSVLVILGIFLFAFGIIAFFLHVLFSWFQYDSATNVAVVRRGSTLDAIKNLLIEAPLFGGPSAVEENDRVRQLELVSTDSQRRISDVSSHSNNSKLRVHRVNSPEVHALELEQLNSENLDRLRSDSQTDDDLMSRQSSAGDFVGSDTQPVVVHEVDRDRDEKERRKSSRVPVKRTTSTFEYNMSEKEMAEAFLRKDSFVRNNEVRTIAEGIDGPEDNPELSREDDNDRADVNTPTRLGAHQRSMSANRERRASDDMDIAPGGERRWWQPKHTYRKKYRGDKEMFITALTDSARAADYWFVLIIVGLVAMVPAGMWVIGTMMDDQSTMERCHRNHLCQRNLHWFGFVQLDGFNHVVSNVAYLFVAAFLAVYIYWFERVRRRSSSYKYSLQSDKNLFYAISVSIALAGLFSAIYHFCPTQENFQLDSMFMFFLSGTCYVSLYRKRHGIFIIRPLNFFMIFTCIVLFNGWGVYLRWNDSMILFWVVFIPVFLLASVFGSMRLYYYKHTYRYIMGVIAENIATCSFKPRRRARFIHLSLVNFFNWFVVLSCVSIGYDTAIMFLLLSFGDYVMYLCYYIVMKMHYSRDYPAEKPRFYIYILFLLFVGCIGWAGYYFLDDTSEKSLPLHVSREFNRSCDFLSVDRHDLWHILTAFIVMFMALILYHVDDGMQLHDAHVF
jgi:dsRNA-gated channel SID-1